MTKDPLSAKLDRLIELRHRLRGEEDFTNHHIQELYAEYRTLLGQVIGPIRPIMQRWIEAGIIQVDCQLEDGASKLFEPESIYVNGSLTLKCAMPDSV